MMQPSIKPADEHSAGDIIARIGSLTRMLRDSLRELGLDQAIYSAAIFLIPICISFDTAEKRRYATYLILNRRFSFEF